MHNQQEDNQKPRIEMSGGASVGGNVETGGGNFIGRDLNISGDYHQTIIVQPSTVADDLQKNQENYKDHPLLKILYDEEDCSQSSQVGLHHLVKMTGQDAVMLEASLAELEKVGLVKHITRVENQRTFDFYSITKQGKVLVIRSRSSLQPR